MADAYHHALSSQKKWGGAITDYLPIHEWFDSSKNSMCDFRHRAMYHHAEGIALCIKLHGPTITNSSGRVIPVRWIGEQHVQEDLKHIPNAADWFRCIQPTGWMMKPEKLPEEVK